MLKTMRQDH